MNKKLNILLQPSRLVAAFLARYCTWLPEDVFLRLRYRLLMHKKLHLENPATFTEKLQWLKLHDRKPIYTKMADKFEVKEYVANIIGDCYVIPTLGVWDTFEDIDFSLLPDKFVLKSTNGGGGSGVIICKDKSTFDKKTARNILNNSMKIPASAMQGEWVYKDIKPRIIAEKFLAPENNSLPVELLDYKFFCFNGKVKFFKVDFGRFVEHHANYYDTDGNLLPFGEVLCPPDPAYSIDLPTNLSDMITLAERLSKNEPFLRVDFYNVNVNIFFGELTFYPSSGFGDFTSEEWDLIIGDMLVLPETGGNICHS